MSDDIQREAMKIAGEVVGEALDKLPKVSGRVKPTAGKLIRDALFEEDIGEVLRDVRREVGVPTLKEACCNMLMEIIQRWFYGSGPKPPRRDVYERSSIMRPDTSDPRYVGSALARGRGGTYRDTATRFRADDVIMKTAEKATQVIDSLKDVIYRKGYVTMAQLYDIASYEDEDYIGTLDPMDNDYGWTDLSSARKRHVYDGWLVVLPEPKPLNKTGEGRR